MAIFQGRDIVRQLRGSFRVRVGTSQRQEQFTKELLGKVKNRATKAPSQSLELANALMQPRRNAQETNERG